MRFADGMIVRNFQASGMMVALVSAFGVFSAKAELPTLDDRKWVGNFLALENKHYHFSVSTRGRGKVEVVGKQGKTIGEMSAVTVDFVIQETLPDGKTVTKTVQAESLESPQPAALKLANVVIRGKVTGDAAFEAYLNEERGTLSLGGKLLNPGTLKNPLRFGIRVNFPARYTNSNDKPGENDSKADAKKAAKALEEKSEKDRLQLKMMDGKSRKQSLTDAVDASTAEVNGPGIAALSLETSSYQEKKIMLLASENSSMTLSNTSAKPLNTGFSVIWTADSAKDPEAKARLSIDVK